MSERKRDFFRWAHCTVSVLVFSLALGSGMLLAQTDPGVRGGAPGAGGQITGLTIKEGKFSDAGLDAFTEVQSGQLRRLPFATGYWRNEPFYKSSNRGGN